MLTPAECKNNAALCLEAMRAAMSPEVKDTLKSMARRWSELAERAERQERTQNPRPYLNEDRRSR
jgi:hypothetical protein